MPAHGDPTLIESGIEINLAELQKTLDRQGLEIVENQKEGMVGRKKLAEQTRGTSGSYSGRFARVLISRVAEFKKVAEEEKGPAFKTLLKGNDLSLCLWRKSEN